VGACQLAAWKAAARPVAPPGSPTECAACLSTNAQADAAAAEDSPLFLYHKAYLRPGAPPPPQEPLPMLEVTGVWTRVAEGS
jgi:hypothetical protein